MEIYLAYLLDLIQICSGVSGQDRIAARLTSYFECLAFVRVAEMETGGVTCLDYKCRGQQPPLLLCATRGN